jgi:hypothetical protein
MCLFRYSLPVVFISLILGVPYSSFAEPKKSRGQIVPQPIQEMFQSNLVYPQEKDEIQFTLFPSFKKSQDAQKIRTLFEVEYGITDALQVIFEWDGLLYKNPRINPAIAGVGNIEVGAQYSWMGMGDGNTHFSFGNLIEFPVGPVESGLTEGFLEIQPFIVLARDFPEFNQSQVFLEFGFDWVKQIRNVPESIEPEIDNISWNIGAFYPIELWRATLEINGNNNKLDGGSINEIYITPGTIYKLSREWEIGMATPIGITKTSDDYRVIGYLMWEFELD